MKAFVAPQSAPFQPTHPDGYHDMYSVLHTHTDTHKEGCGDDTHLMMSR